MLCTTYKTSIMVKLGDMNIAAKDGNGLQNKWRFKMWSLTPFSSPGY
uniref:Uncharacterized protein n=1 Tax=Arundo donax TaxID=35708 RepID=A0A0A9FSD4_ARUDO